MTSSRFSRINLFQSSNTLKMFLSGASIKKSIKMITKLILERPLESQTPRFKRGKLKFVIILEKKLSLLPLTFNYVAEKRSLKPKSRTKERNMKKIPILARLKFRDLSK